MSQAIGYATNLSFTGRKPRAHVGQPLREELWQRGIMPSLAKHDEKHGIGLGVYRWVDERTFAWFKGFHCVRLSFERIAFMREAAPILGACLVCFRALQARLKTNS